MEEATPPVVAPQQQPKKCPKEVSEIKTHRVKGGERQYCVVYRGETGAKGHWFAAEALSCGELIDEYEKKVEQAKAAHVSANRRVVEICGIVDGSVEPNSFVVRFSNSREQQVVTRQYLQKRSTKLLLEFYERNIVFEELPAKPAPAKQVKADM